MNNVKCKHVYAVPHKVVVRKVVEEVAEDGLPCQRYEKVNLLTPKQVDSIPYHNFDLETQVATNQPIKRINTVSLEPSEISSSQLSQLENVIATAKLELNQKNE